MAVETLASCGFVVAVYEAVVAGGIAAWPGAGDHEILLLWVAAAVIAGTGLPRVRSLTRALAHRAVPPPGPYPVLRSSVTGLAGAGPLDGALSRLAELLVAGTGARHVSVWLAGPGGLRRSGWWPPGTVPGQPATAPGEPELLGLPGVDHVAPVRNAGQVLGALALAAPGGRPLAPPELRLASDVANAAGLLLRNAELAQRLARQVAAETAQAADLARSRRRVVVARDAAREQLSAEIAARVCEPLERCGQEIERARHGPDGTAAGLRLAARLASMTREIDTAIADFRQIVHGVYPPVLTDHGLLAALENLLAGIDPRAVLLAHQVPRLPARTEAGVYFCAASLLRDWDTAGTRRPLRAVVQVARNEIQLTLSDRVEDTGSRPALPVSPLVLEAAWDRAAALDGTLLAENDDYGRCLVLRVPLAPGSATTPGSDAPGNGVPGTTTPDTAPPQDVPPERASAGSGER